MNQGTPFFQLYVLSTFSSFPPDDKHPAGIVISTDRITMAFVVYGGEMTNEPYMSNEYLYLVCPEGLVDGRTAHVFGTWTETFHDNKKEKLALINYSCTSITSTEYKIEKEGGRYSLHINVVSGDSGEYLHVSLPDSKEDVPSGVGILYKLE